MKKLTNQLVGSLAVLSILAGCGSDSGNDSGSAAQEERSQGERIALDGSNIDGFYKAEFITLNKHIAGTVPGSVSFTRKEDRLYIYLRLFAGAPKAWHRQAVYTGTRCPTIKDDLNGDGFIDIQEAYKVVGDVLIPLDSDPGTQASGRNFYPLGDPSGSYHYERIVNFNRFFSDLQAEDKDPTDNVVKLGPNKGLSLIGKVVMIQGVAQPTPEGTELPEGQFPSPQVPEETVATYGRYKNWQTLPIACGIFSKMSDEAPGSAWVNDEIPGPVADVVEGQDQPAPDDDTQTTGSGTSGSTTGSTNDSDDGNGPVSDGNTTSGTTTGSSTTTGGTTGGTSGGTTGGTTGGVTTGGTSGGWTGWTGWTGGGRTSGSSTSGSTTSSGSGSGTTTGGTTGAPDYGSEGSTTTTTTTTGSGSSGSSSSSSSSSDGE